MKENKNGVLSPTGRCYQTPSAAGPKGVMLADAEIQARQDANRVTRASLPAKSGLLRTLRIVIGLILLCSASLKLWRFTHLRTAPPPLKGMLGFTPALIGWVTFLGLWLLTGAFFNVARWTAIMCFSLFSCYGLYEAISGRSSCGCFGQVHVDPWFTVILDMAIVLALALMAGHVNVPARRAKLKWPVAAALGTGLAAGIFSAVLHPRPVAASYGLTTANGGKIVILEPPKWIGHQLPVLAHIVSAVLSGPGAARPHAISLKQRLDHGQWVVLFYRAGCDECRQAIPAYEALAQHEHSADPMPQVAFIRIPSDPPTPQPRGLFHTDAAVHGTLDATHEWFATTPVAVELVAGKAIAAASGQAAMNLNWVK
ncbi:MAG: hypothetical protein HKL96_04635 [Phycisphaerales bacterium]|nr:hypothetical protein [Phycisphaerales bacterium]